MRRAIERDPTRTGLWRELIASGEVTIQEMVAAVQELEEARVGPPSHYPTGSCFPTDAPREYLAMWKGIPARQAVATRLSLGLHVRDTHLDATTGDEVARRVLLQAEALQAGKPQVAGAMRTFAIGRSPMGVYRHVAQRLQMGRGDSTTLLGALRHRRLAAAAMNAQLREIARAGGSPGGVAAVLLNDAGHVIVDVQKHEERKIDLLFAGEVWPVVALPGSDSFLVQAVGFGLSAAASIIPRQTRFFLVDARSSRIQPQPWLDGRNRPIQSTGRPREVWMARYQARDDCTEVGRFDTRSSTFTRVAAYPYLQFRSHGMWVDEPSAWLYVRHDGCLLRLPLHPETTAWTYPSVTQPTDAAPASPPPASTPLRRPPARERERMPAEGEGRLVSSATSEPRW